MQTTTSTPTKAKGPNHVPVPAHVPLPAQNFPAVDIRAHVAMKTDYVRKDGTCALYIAVQFQKQRFRFNTRIAIAPKHFNSDKGEVRRSHPHHFDLNLFLKERLARIHELRVAARLGKIKVTQDLLRYYVQSETLAGSFLEYWERRMRIRETEIHYNTLKSDRSVLKGLRRFQPMIAFEDISEELINRYKASMRGNDYKETTIDKHLCTIKVYLRLAQEDGHQFDFPQKSLKRRSIVAKKDILTQAQLQHLQLLYEQQYFKPETHQVLRYFLFSCYTGLRFSDILRLEKQNFEGPRLIFVPTKTSRRKHKIVTFTMPQKALNLLGENLDQPLGTIISNQKTNDKLKRIGKVVQHKRLTYHISRHTFATVMLQRGANIEVVSKIMGHSSIKQTMVYADIVDESKDAALRLFDEM